MPSRRLLRIGAFVLGLGISVAFADDQPPLVPTRDVAVTYRVQDSQAAPRMLRIYFDAADERVHVDPPGRPGYFVIDRKAGQMTVVNTATRSYVQLSVLPATWRLDLMFRTPDRDGCRCIFLGSNEALMAHLIFWPTSLHFARKGTDGVAGYVCTVWLLSWSPLANVEVVWNACITVDGVVLSGHLAKEPTPEAGIQAVSIAYGPQPASLFVAPGGYRRLQPGQRPWMGGLAGTPPGGAAPPSSRGLMLTKP